ncbi:glycosyl hydrolase family 30, partial [Phaeodactylibacter luteus]
MGLEIYETSAAGSKLGLKEAGGEAEPDKRLTLRPEERFQTITGIGGSFTEASAYLLNELSPENRQKVLEAYFGPSG